MNTRINSLLFCIFTGCLAQAQVALNTTGANPGKLARLDISSTIKELNIINGAFNQDLLLTLYTNTGQALMKKNVSITGTVDTYTLPLAGLPAGVYHLSLQSPGINKTLSFTKE
jgi:hypothetical protein